MPKAHMEHPVDQTTLRLEHILRTLRAHLPELRERYGVKSLGVFGSYVRGEQRKRSDLDILVEFEDEAWPGLFEFIGLQQDLSDLVGVKVDLVEKKGLKPYIGRRILEEVFYLSQNESGLARPRITRGGHMSAKPKREIRDYLKDILDNVANVEHFTEGVDFETFSSDMQKVYAVLHGLLIIGEAARNIPVSLRRRYPEVPWRSIVGLRNVVAYAYFAVNLPRIWAIMRDDLPRLRDVVAQMWKEQEGNDG